MTQLTVRNVSEQIVRTLKQRAAAHGRSAEAEHLEVLREPLLEREEDFAARAKALRQRLRSTVDSSEIMRADRRRGRRAGARPHAEVARIPMTRLADPDGSVRPGNPKGTAVTSDGRYAVVSGGRRLDPNAPPSGTVWVIDLHKRAVVATVTGVGNDPYGLTILEDRPD